MKQKMKIVGEILWYEKKWIGYQSLEYVAGVKGFLKFNNTVEIPETHVIETDGNLWSIRPKTSVEHA